MKYRVTYEVTQGYLIEADDIAEAAKMATEMVDAEYPGIAFRIEMEEE